MVVTPSAHSLTVPPRIQARLQNGELTRSRVNEFQDFLNQVDRVIVQHRILTDNAYTRRFQAGNATDEELRYFIQS